MSAKGKCLSWGNLFTKLSIILEIDSTNHQHINQAHYLSKQNEGLILLILCISFEKFCFNNKCKHSVREPY